MGGLVAVFGLLLICLRLLGKYNSRGSRGQADLLTVWNLGPKREIQVLQLEDQVHYIYRHDGAMVVLKQVPAGDFQADTGERGGGRESSLARLLTRGFSFAGLRQPKAGPDPAS